MKKQFIKIRGAVIARPGDVLMVEVGDISQKDVDEFTEKLTKQIKPYGIHCLVLASAKIKAIARKK